MNLIRYFATTTDSPEAAKPEASFSKRIAAQSGGVAVGVTLAFVVRLLSGHRPDWASSLVIGFAIAIGLAAGNILLARSKAPG